MKRAFIALALAAFAPGAVSAAPRYIRGKTRPFAAARVARVAEPGPAPSEAVQEPRIRRVVAAAYRAEPAAEPVALPPARMIDAEALHSLFARTESGGGFMPLTLRGSSIEPR